jgi:hypothetical protein
MFYFVNRLEVVRETGRWWREEWRVMNVFEGEKGKEGAHETKESERAWTRDVPLVGPALEGNESAETKGGAPDILQPCESSRRRSSDRRFTNRALQSSCPAGREFCAAGSTAADLVESSSIADLPEKNGSLFDSQVWLSTKDAAIYLRKFRTIDGKPSEGAIRNAIWRGQLKARKWRRRLYIHRADLDRLLRNLPFTNGGGAWA